MMQDRIERFVKNVIAALGHCVAEVLDVIGHTRHTDIAKPHLPTNRRRPRGDARHENASKPPRAFDEQQSAFASWQGLEYQTGKCSSRGDGYCVAQPEQKVSDQNHEQSGNQLQFLGVVTGNALVGCTGSVSAARKQSVSQ